MEEEEEGIIQRRRRRRRISNMDSLPTVNKSHKCPPPPQAFCPRCAPPLPTYLGL
jgi:hypothetical protein